MLLPVRLHLDLELGHVLGYLLELDAEHGHGHHLGRHGTPGSDLTRPTAATAPERWNAPAATISAPTTNTPPPATISSPPSSPRISLLRIRHEYGSDGPCPNTRPRCPPPRLNAQSDPAAAGDEPAAAAADPPPPTPAVDVDAGHFPDAAHFATVAAFATRALYEAPPGWQVAHRSKYRAKFPATCPPVLPASACPLADAFTSPTWAARSLGQLPVTSDAAFGYDFALNCQIPYDMNPLESMTAASGFSPDSAIPFAMIPIACTVENPALISARYTWSGLTVQAMSRP